MESQTDVFNRLFVVPSTDPKTCAIQKECMQYVQELFGRKTFDNDCADFHRWYTETGLDFARCWVSVRHTRDVWKQEYETICDAHNLQSHH